MSFNINMLPYEVLEGVFYYLEDCQRLEASLVCQQWISILNSNELLKGICLLVNKDNYTHLAALSTPTRRFRHFKFKSVRLDINFLEFMRSNYHFIRTLSFADCSYEKDDFGADKSLPLDGLKCLNILASCNVLDLFTSLQNLEELFINDLCFKDCHLKKLQQITAKLKRIHLENVNIFNIKKTDGCFSNKEVSIHSIESFITQHSTTLENLWIDNLPSYFISTIVTVPSLKLKEFQFPFSCKPSAVVEFCQLQPSLTLIETHFVSFDKSHWEDIVQRNPQLQSLYLHFSKIPDINQLLELKLLKELHLSLCDFDKDVAIAIPSTSLKKLDCCEMSSTFLLKLLPCIRGIQDLTLSCGVTDEVMWMISATLTNLKVLCIHRCYNLTDSGLTGRILQGGESKSSPVPISNLIGLTGIAFTSVPNITEKCVVETIQFPFLISLGFWNCCQITENIRPALLERNPCLKMCKIGSTKE